MYGRCREPLIALAALLLGTGCQVDLPLASGGGSLAPEAAAPSQSAPSQSAPSQSVPSQSVPSEQEPATAPTAMPPAAMPDVEPGPYRRDPRWPPFVRGWPERVDRALERLGVVTGLAFAATGRPRVVLRPFREETRTHELRAEIIEGRRRSVVHVNIEPLIAGVHDPDRVLLRALAEAAFQDAGRRHAPVPAWFVHFASTVAAGDAEQRFASLRRRGFEDGDGVLDVDPEDPTVAEATGLAAFALLAERLDPAGMRRAILFVADGDEAGSVLGRLSREADGGWPRPARLALGERLAAVELEPWRLLARARTAAADLGRSGLEAVLPEDVPPEVADEIALLRARTALAEGDVEAARTAVRTLGPDAAATLDDPGAALALRIDLESRAGGSAGTARRLASQLDRDFPRNAARLRLRDTHPLLGSQEDPQRWLAMMRERIETGGTGTIDLDTLGRYLRMLVVDHRAGAADALLSDLGARREAPELEPVAALVADAQSDPVPAAVARGRERVARWAQADEPEAARDVRETGRAAGPALLALLEAPSSSLRTRAVRMLAATLGDDAAVAAVRAGWPGHPARVQRDLFALAAAVPFDPLEAVLDGEGLGEPEAQALAKAWERLTLGLSRRWLAAQPTFLQQLRSETFAVRRDAFVRIGREAPAEITPAFIAFGLQDRAALLRREAASLAGIAGFRALALRALDDPAWLVREEAVRAIVRIDGRDAVGLLAVRLAEDPSLEVRAAAAMGLVRAAPESPRAVDALLASQVAEEARLRDAIGARLAELPPTPVVQGIVRGWRRAMARREPSRGYLFRTALLYGRLTGTALGYYPGATRAERAAMLRTMEDWLQSDAARAVPDRGSARRTPAGRAR